MQRETFKLDAKYARYSIKMFAQTLRVAAQNSVAARKNNPEKHNLDLYKIEIPNVILLPEEKIPPCPPDAACLYLCFPGLTPKYSNLISGSEHNINASTTHFIENVKPRVQETHSQPRLTSDNLETNSSNYCT